MTRNDIARAALLEAGRPDLADVLLPENGITLWWNWQRLGRMPTMDEVRLVDRADHIARGVHASACFSVEEWHEQIVTHLRKLGY